MKKLFSEWIECNPNLKYLNIATVDLNGVLRGLFLGTKRILKCHPIKFLGGGSGFDPAPNLKKEKK